MGMVEGIEFMEIVEGLACRISKIRRVVPGVLASSFGVVVLGV